MQAAPSTATAFAPLRQPEFRMLWLVWLAANLTLWMNDVASAWLMTSLTDQPYMVAMVQASLTLPLFLLGLPSGALADIVDRRRYFALTHVWVAAVAIVLAGLSFGGALSAPLLLACSFANGIGMAMRWPLFAAILPDLVRRDALSGALALNGVAANLSRVVGPVIAGALIAGAGSEWVFLLNGALSVAALALILRWRPPPKTSALPGERLGGAMRRGLQHVLQSPRLRVILLRIFLFFLQTSALMALLPLVARRLDGGGPAAFTTLLAALGAGAVLIAFKLESLRRRASRASLVGAGICVHAAASAAVALAPNLWLAAPAAAVAGMAWIATANSLTVAMQLALPNWVRARGMAIYQMAVMGGSAAGAALWGALATVASVQAAIVSAAALGPLVFLLSRRRGVGGNFDEDLTPAAAAQVPPPVIAIGPHEGPVLVTIEYLIDPARAREFDAVMRQTRLARLRQGARAWGLFRDTARAGCYIEHFLDENWTEHQRRLERFTAADIGLGQRRLAFHIGAAPPRTSRYVGAPDAGPGVPPL
ncbi:MAG: MFS transporter [Pseudomonadota bacterium]